jgi:general secretion pathway protein D
VITAPTTPTVNIPGVDSLLGSGSTEFSSLVTIIPDERSNAVVVSGTVDDIRLLTALIEKIDTILAQVRIEVVIVEVTLDDNSASGISALGLNVSGDKLVGFSGANETLNISSGTVTRPGGNVSVSGPWDLAATIAIGTTPRKNNTSTLSVPSITTSHAKKATFISSEQRPVITGTQSSVTGTGGTPVTSSTVAQQDIGITLTVTPLIGNDGTVQMAITQDVKDVVGSIKVDTNDQPIISHRSTDSFITARSGDILVLGGMQRKKESKTTNRLGPIPIIGDLLGSRTSDKGRTELIFFLRPTILTNTGTDNAPALKRVEELPQKDVILKEIDPKYVAPKKNLLQKVIE